MQDFTVLNKGYYSWKVWANKMSFFFFTVVDGHWSHWTYFPCGVSCGKGQRNRTRTCTNPSPLGGGKDCSGTGLETLDCYNPPCPGKLLQWCTIIFISERNKLILQRYMPDTSDVKQGHQYHTKRHYVYFFFKLPAVGEWLVWHTSLFFICFSVPFFLRRVFIDYLFHCLFWLVCLSVSQSISLFRDIS